MMADATPAAATTTMAPSAHAFHVHPSVAALSCLQPTEARVRDIPAKLTKGPGIGFARRPRPEFAPVPYPVHRGAGMRDRPADYPGAGLPPDIRTVADGPRRARAS
jgi:hypothetical protein